MAFVSSLFIKQPVGNKLFITLAQNRNRYDTKA